MGVNSMAKVSFVIGANCTGKSWFVDQHFSKEGVRTLDIYDFQQQVYNDKGYGDSVPVNRMFSCLWEANDRLLKEIIAALRQGKDVAVEQTFFKAKRRIAYIDEILREVPGVIIEVYVMCPGDAQLRDNLRKRNHEGSFKRIKQEMTELMEFPNPSEGFDMIYEVIDGEPTPRMDPEIREIVDEARRELEEEAARIRTEEEARRKKQELLDSMNTRPFWHYCEVCGKKEFLTADEAHEQGWDYPPKIGSFGLLGPRTCGDCALVDTLYWKINSSGRLPIVIEENLTPEERVTWQRIRTEPESLLEE